METNQRLKETLDRFREELRTARAQAERSQHEAERFSKLTKCQAVLSITTHSFLLTVHLSSSRQVEDRRVEWLEEKHKLQEREAELQQKYSQAKEKLQRAAVAQKKVPLLPAVCENAS